MKKINSIGYGAKVIGIGMLFALIIPIIISVISCFIELAFLNIFAKVSCIVGGIILFAFFILLMIELHQDKRLNSYYEGQKNRKLPLENGRYECQACGNREVGVKDKICRICGIEFRNEDHE